MTLDPLLFDTYKRYKAGTTKFVSWLADTARRTGLVDDMFLPVASSASKGKGKGKARAKGKKKKYDGPKTSQILIRDFTRLAEVVTGSSNNVPSHILRTLRDTIAARRLCAQWFTSHQNQPDDTTKAHNEGHQHFIRVLEEVFEILNQSTLDATDPHAANSEAQVNPDQEVKEVTNIFEYLEVEDPADSEWISEAVPPHQLPKKEVSYEIEPSDEELSFAIFCFFKDLADIRHFVRQTWAEYREHRITLMTAAVIMNTAIDVFRRLNEDFVSPFPQFDQHGKIIAYLYEGYCDPNSRTSIASEFDSDFATYQSDEFKLSSAVFFCDHTFEVIQEFFLGCELPFYNPSPDIKLTHDEEVLFQCLSLFGLIDLQYKGDFEGDQLIKGLSKVRKDKKVYTWVVLALQLFVDARRVLGKELGRCVDELHSMQGWMSETLRECHDFGRTNRVNHWHKLNDASLLDLERGLGDVVKRDIVQNLLDHHFGAYGARYSWGRFFLFSNHPMLCGLVMHNAMCHFHRLGVSIGGDQGAIISAIHLYNAAHQSRYLPLPFKWADLERLIAMQGPSWIFLGERPEGPLDCFRHYSCVMGTSAIIAARDRNGKPPLKAMTAISHTHIVPRSRQGNRKLRVVSRYVELSQRRVGKRIVPTRAAEDVTVMLEMMVAKCLEEKLDSAAAGAKKAAKHHKLTPLQKLSVFKQGLQAEEFPLNFDLFALNQRCIELLRRVQKICLEESPANYPLAEYGTDILK